MREEILKQIEGLAKDAQSFEEIKRILSEYKISSKEDDKTQIDSFISEEVSEKKYYEQKILGVQNF